MDHAWRPLAALTTSLGLLAPMLAGCVEDPDCGICDPENLVLEMMVAVNYRQEKVFHVSPECEGERCPAPFDTGEYFIETIERCSETEAALADPRGPEEHCRFSPLLVESGIELVFNNLLEPTSVELVRKDPTEPDFFEVYDWKSGIVELRGPTTRYNGDYRRGQGALPDVVSRAVNLSCIENLDSSIPFHELVEADPLVCDKVQLVGGELRPLRTQAEGVMRPYDGNTTPWGAECETPEEGPDTCCTICDYLLSVAVAKYGADGAGERRNPDNAIACEPSGDIYDECRAFIPRVDREVVEHEYRYDWDADGVVADDEVFAVPRFDRLRETHPDDRPPFEQRNQPCEDHNDCSDAGLDGYECVGRDANGLACESGDDCEDLRCQAEWFVHCEFDDNLGAAHCVDKRFRDQGAGACYERGGERLAACDANENGVLTAEECCDPSLGGVCDPLFQPGVVSIERFDRAEDLPAETRDCYCGDPAAQDAHCAELIEANCTAPWGSLERHDGASNAGDYAVRLVGREGGVIYDPALKGVLVLPADLGNEERAPVERCADQTAQIEPRTVADGWRAGDSGRKLENVENYDRALCSGSEYRLVFATDGEHVADKVGNTMADKNTYVFETAQFHVVPDSGYPADEQRIAACDPLTIAFSNKYDPSPHNLRKLELWSLNPTICDDPLQPDCWSPGELVAGGVDCVDEGVQFATQGGVPCLTADVVDQHRGIVTVSIDVVRFGKQLQNLGRYRLRIPGLENYASLDALAADYPPGSPAFEQRYQAAFHDACGMPLITAGSTALDFVHDFSIDEPVCTEDEDGDGAQIACDNAKDFYNPDQANADGDRFGDVWDLCPTLPSDVNTLDADKDGVGNDCDRCADTASQYNDEAEWLAIEPYLWVRNMPDQGDVDQDGIGDACDNCVATPNCGTFGSDQPWVVGTPIDKDDEQGCQADEDDDMVGDACAGGESPGAAGPVDFTNDGDFDQDGLANANDLCPRQPVVASPCSTDEDCGPERDCDTSAGLCNHGDRDSDGVGNICDTCPMVANPAQLTAPSEDDPDGDFVGSVCETEPACEDRADPRPFDFYPVSVDGLCCTTTYPGDGQYVMGSDGSWKCEGLCDPDGLPVTIDCEHDPGPGLGHVADGVLCRKLTPQVLERAGVVNLPPGCEQALTEAGLTDATHLPLRPGDFQDDPGELYAHICQMPQWDQDQDGVGDACDLCPFAYDPTNAFGDDFNGRFPSAGAACVGDYSPAELCGDEDDEDAKTPADDDTGG